jgi:hypothetical protein
MPNRIQPWQVVELTSLSVHKVQEPAPESAILSTAKLGVWMSEPANVQCAVVDLDAERQVGRVRRTHDRLRTPLSEAGA